MLKKPRTPAPAPTKPRKPAPLSILHAIDRQRPIYNILTRLDNVTKVGGQYSARCPAHCDRRNSLSISETRDGIVLIHCHAYCRFENIVTCLGVGAYELFPNNPQPNIILEKPSEPTPEATARWAQLAGTYSSWLTAERLTHLARTLCVSESSLLELGLGWSEHDGAWTFPERNAIGDVIGIMRRYPNGEKKVMAGGHRGLYFAHDWRDRTGPVYVPEGASDVAALINIGLNAVGRPSCAGGFDLLAELLVGTDFEVLILGENDLKVDGHWPGRDGACRLAAKLVGAGINAKWTLPPNGFKDVRDFLNSTEEGT
jgi:hypothetical protein